MADENEDEHGTQSGFDETDIVDEFINKKTGRVAKSKSKAEKAWMWTHDEITRMVTLWTQEQCLYRPSCTDYKDKTKRQNAIERRSRFSNHGFTPIYR